MRLAAAIALALVAACSSFDSGTASNAGAGDGGVGSTPDGSSSSDAGGDPSCSVAFPLEPFATTENPAGWAQQGTGSMGTLEVTAAPYLNAQGNYLHVSIKNSTGVNEPPRLISPPIALAKHVRLEYDLAIKQAEHYGEVGCQLELWGPTAGQDLVVLYLGVERTTGVSLIGGWNYDAVGAAHQSDETTLVAGWQPAKWQHVMMEATIDQSQVSMQISIDGGSPATIHPPTATYSFAEMHLRCGVLYLSPVPDGVEQTMDLGIDNIRVSACAP